MNTDKHRWKRREFGRLFILVVCLLFLAPALNAQDKDPLEDIPEHLRGSLRSELRLVVHYQKTSNWEKLYDLLVPEWRGGTCDEYVRKSKEWRTRPKLAKFTPTGLSTEVFTPEGIVDISKENQWIIMGCGEYGWGWFKEKNLSSVEAHWDGERWFFSEVLVVFESLHGPPASCPRKPKSSNQKPAKP